MTERLLLLTPDSSYTADIGWTLDNQRAALSAAGFDVDTTPWDAVGDVAAYDLVLAMMAWNYHEQPHRWLALLDRAEREGWPLVNSAPLMRWNSDKAYLTQLAGYGVSVVPTRSVASMDDAALDALSAEWDDIVIKPAISANGMMTYRLRPGDALPDEVRGRPMMAQPFRRGIVEEGEWSLIFFDGRFSHALIKNARDGDFRVQITYGGTSDDAEAPAAALDSAQVALAAMPEPATYARIDLVREGDRFELMELELIEPALFLSHAPDKGQAFGTAIRSAATRLAR